MQRKVFRIEQTFDTHGVADARDARPGDAADALLKRELAATRDIVAQHRSELAALIGDSDGRRMMRAAGELGAAIDGMDKATQSILNSAESVDDGARTLAAALTNDHERALARDIQDQVMRIYESCSFQDLAGQRIGKVMALLGTLEERLGAMLAACDGRAAPTARPAAARRGGLINGPKLDGDGGHASQHDIDKLFG